MIASYLSILRCRALGSIKDTNRLDRKIAQGDNESIPTKDMSIFARNACKMHSLGDQCAIARTTDARNKCGASSATGETHMAIFLPFNCERRLGSSRITCGLSIA
jgi:hypothetical protein